VQEHVFAEISSAVEGGDRGEGFGKGEDYTTVDEGCYVSDEDLLDDVPPCIAEDVKDSTCLTFVRLIR
jgi:hypothetical protein